MLWRFSHNHGEARERPLTASCPITHLSVSQQRSRRLLLLKHDQYLNEDVILSLARPFVL